MSAKYKQLVTVEMDPDLPMDYLHGVMGGITLGGEIEMDFYSETEALPAPSELLVTESGGVVMNEHTDQDSEELVTRRTVRTIHTRTLMTVDQARSLVQWLMRQIDLCEDVPLEEESYPRTSC